MTNDLRIADAPLLVDVSGEEKLPTGGYGNYSTTINQIADFTQLKWKLATEGYVGNEISIVTNKLNNHTQDKTNPHGVTKEQVGLGEVDNTADLDKPVSAYQRTAIDEKIDKSSIVDNLTTNESTKVLSAKQGKVLQDSKVDKTYLDDVLDLKADKSYVSEIVLTANGNITNFEKEVDLLEYFPEQENFTAKALDTKKVWFWNGSMWKDTGLSELDLAKSYVDRLADSKDESLDIFQVEDSAGQITLKQTPDAHLHIPHIAGSVQDNINNIKNQISHDTSNDIAQFHDAVGNITFRQKANGDIIWASSNKTLNERFDEVDSKFYQDESKDLLVVYDELNNKVAVFTEDQDLMIGQVPDGIGAKLNSEHLTSKTSNIHHSNYFLMREDAVLVIASMSALNPVLRAPIPLNYVPLNFDPPTTLLSLQIEQPEISKLNTVYQDDDGVVHPHIIEFYDKFNGAKYWLGITGYYLTQDKFENPFLFASDDLKNFKMFDDYPQPLAERPVSEQIGDHQYNSDIFQFYDFHNGQLCMGFRTTRKKGNEASRNSISYRSTKDGKNWSDVKVLVPQTDGTGSDIYLSPSVIYDFINKKYLMYAVDGENRRYELIRWECRFLGDKWVNRTVIDTPRHFTPWHCDVRYCGNKITALIQDNNDTQNMYLGLSNDNGNTFEFGNPILTGDFHKPYKATFLSIIDEDTKQIALNFLWTSRHLPENDSEKWRLYSQKTTFINLVSE